MPGFDFEFGLGSETPHVVRLRVKVRIVRIRSGSTLVTKNHDRSTRTVSKVFDKSLFEVLKWLSLAWNK